MASSSRVPSKRSTSSRPWYEDVENKLVPDHPFLKQSSKYIDESISILPPVLDQRPYSPPPGTTTFFVGQFGGGLRLPVPPCYLDILSFYRIPINHLTPNSIRILAGTFVVFRHLNLPLSPQVFHCFYRLKMTEPGLFHFQGRPVCQFLTDNPSSHKGWKNYFFFVHLPFPLPYESNWHSGLPSLPDVRHTRATCDFSSILPILLQHRYSLSRLLKEEILFHFHLSHYPSICLQSIGNSKVIL